MAASPQTGPAPFAFQLNGETIRVKDNCPQTTLLDFLRAQGLTGAKEGCAEGECGACTVVMVKECAGGTAYVPVNSCLMLLPMAAGQEVLSVEALARGGELHPVQRAMVEHGGSQCGYCTPGFVMSLFAEYYRPGRVALCDAHAMSGNLCRCTGYRPIRDAALSLGPVAADAGPFCSRLSQPAPALDEVFCDGSDGSFSRPASLAQALGILARDPSAQAISGGTDLVVESNLRNRRFPHLVSLEALEELRIFRDSRDQVEIGAGLSLTEIGEKWESAPRVFRDWLLLFSSPLIRNRATLGGNLATASPIGDAAPLLLALDAQVRIVDARGERTIDLHEFFLGYRKTALRAGDILLSISIPKPFPERIRFYKAAKRRMDDISTVAACFAVTLGGKSKVQRARFAYGGVAAVPTRCKEAEDVVLGRPWSAGALRQAQNAIAGSLHPISDHRGSAEYRLALAQSFLERFGLEL
jgi:xanthine dehydrogenase small subunit